MNASAQTNAIGEPVSIFSYDHLHIIIQRRQQATGETKAIRRFAKVSIVSYSLLCDYEPSDGTFSPQLSVTKPFSRQALLPVSGVG